MSKQQVELTQIEAVNNLHWKFADSKTHIRIEKLRDFELEKIRMIVRNNSDTHPIWFAISAEQWFDDVTFLLKHRKKNRELKLQLKGH